jgi:hypothetical protein
MFTVRGTPRERKAEVHWLDEPKLGERLVGDAEVIAEVFDRIEAGREVAATPTGPTFSPALVPAHVALVTILSVLGQDAAVDGDVPEVPGLDVPDGAVS